MSHSPSVTRRLATTPALLVLADGRPRGVHHRLGRPSLPLEQRARDTIERNTVNFNTRAIHVGQEPDPETGAVNVPVFLTSTYAAGVGRRRQVRRLRTR